MRKKATAWQYIKQYKFRSLLLRNFAFIIFMMILPLAIVIASGYGKLDNEVNERIMDMNEDLLRKNATVTDNVILDIQSLLNQIAEQSEIRQILQERDERLIGPMAQGPVYQLIREYTQTNRYIRGVYLYSEENGFIIDGSAGTYRRAADSWEKEKWYYIHKQIPMDDMYVLVNHANSIFLCRPIFSAQGQRLGLTVFDVQLQRIHELLEDESITHSELFFIMDISGQAIYCNQPRYFSLSERQQNRYRDAIGQVKPGESRMLLEESQRFVSVVESASKSWRYALITEQPQYAEETGVLSDFLISSVGISLLTGLLAAYVITFVTYRPVKKIVEVIEKPQQYRAAPQLGRESNELLYITSNILNTLNSKKQMHAELEKRMESLRMAQSLALQFQIDPHFLYNTLETIKWSAIEEMGMGNKTSRLITKVAKLYRVGLESDNVILPLREELAFLQLYIDVLSARFGDLIHYEWRIDESLSECSVIKLCVQPLVENAVSHGLKPKGYEGLIRISAYRQAGKLHIAVEDDGQGMGEAKRQAINKALMERVRPTEKAVGLYNVNERVKLIYGNDYGVTLYAPDDLESGGNKAVITFPDGSGMNRKAMDEEGENR